MALIDIAAIGLCLLVFAYFDHVRPSSGKTVSVPLPVSAQAPVVTPAPVNETAVQTEPAAEPEVVQAHAFDFEGVFTDGEVIVTEDSYISGNICVKTSNIVHSASSGSKYDQSVWVEEIYVRDIESIYCVFAEDSYGSNILEKFESMAERSSSIAAINTDFYGFGKNSDGIVIRNGVLYRSEPNPKDDVLALFRDGNIIMYPAGSVPDAQELLDAGAWQVFSFGPILLEDGKMLSSYEDIDRNPRTVLGMVEPGHYMFIVADGGTAGYAKGYTYKGMAQIALDLGCRVAYNLDGGQSSQMGFMGK